MFFYFRKLPNGRIEVKLNSSYIIDEEHELAGFLEILIPLIQQKNELDIFPKEFGIELYSSLEMMLQRKTEDICLICVEEIKCKEVVEEELDESSEKDSYMLKCKHAFHRGCLEEYINKSSWFKCPKCLRTYGKMLGEMPEGIMTCTLDPENKCAGFNVPTIVIKYDMFEGTRDKEKFDAVKFEAYLPETDDGRKIAKMFQECFRRKLTFAVNKNKENKPMIEWSGIPHKTSLETTELTPNGYPDASYFSWAENYMNGLGIEIDEETTTGC